MAPPYSLWWWLQTVWGHFLLTGSWPVSETFSHFCPLHRIIAVIFSLRRLFDALFCVCIRGDKITCHPSFWKKINFWLKKNLKKHWLTKLFWKKCVWGEKYNSDRGTLPFSSACCAFVEHAPLRLTGWSSSGSGKVHSLSAGPGWRNLMNWTSVNNALHPYSGPPKSGLLHRTTAETDANKTGSVLKRAWVLVTVSAEPLTRSQHPLQSALCHNISFLLPFTPVYATTTVRRRSSRSFRNRLTGSPVQFILG